MCDRTKIGVLGDEGVAEGVVDLDVVELELGAKLGRWVKVCANKSSSTVIERHDFWTIVDWERPVLAISMGKLTTGYE